MINVYIVSFIILEKTKHIYKGEKLLDLNSRSYEINARFNYDDYSEAF